MPTETHRIGMPRYQRAIIKGGTFFFTVTLADRSSNLLIERIEELRHVDRTVQQVQPFETVAICVLPNHLHAIWRLPEGDDDFPSRWNRIKGAFSRGLSAAASRSASKIAKREKGIWQRRYWEHAIRDDKDMAAHITYVHWNPVKHGLVSRVCDWPYSSFHRLVDRGDLPADWGGDITEMPQEFGE